jgi:hypothetical protein
LQAKKACLRNQQEKIKIRIWSWSLLQCRFTDDCGRKVCLTDTAPLRLLHWGCFIKTALLSLPHWGYLLHAFLTLFQVFVCGKYTDGKTLLEEPYTYILMFLASSQSILCNVAGIHISSQKTASITDKLNIELHSNGVRHSSAQACYRTRSSGQE